MRGEDYRFTARVSDNCNVVGWCLKRDSGVVCSVLKVGAANWKKSDRHMKVRNGNTYYRLP